ncbi:MAG TPA: class I SAM-dependent methyltransferase [Flavilitoribacter sp.]|nr:class I SAM-dependent methyltransferase [Flavilitoribacter sp.]HMQ87298.1 class I SAM-dependent methyltransferase [Flavilitoribacter sp.]
MSTDKKEINDLHRSDLYLYFYEDAVDEARTQLECTYIGKHCNISGQQHILDLACGHGRHSLYFAGQGHQVVGIDINKDFIEIARKEAAERNLQVEFLEQDIMEVDYENAFDTVLILFNSLGFFDRADCMTLIEKIGKALKPGGKAFIDARNRDHILKEIQPAFVTEKNGDLMIDRLTFDPVAGTTTNKRIYIKNGHRFDATFTMHMYHYTELALMAEACGLKVDKVFGGWRDEEFRSESRRIVLVISRKS